MLQWTLGVHVFFIYGFFRMAPYSNTLAWKIPWTEEPGRLQSMRSLRVRHDWTTSLSLFTFLHWRRKCNPLQCSCLENPRDGGAWWAAVYGITQSWTRLKWLSSSSSSSEVAVSYGSFIPSFKRISILFSIVAVLIYVTTSSARGFPFLHIASSFYFL